MAAGPGDELAAGRGRLRASHADREQVIGTLKAAFVQGRLAKNEFDQRVGLAFAARTYAELAAVSADLPAGLTMAKPATPARAQGEARVLRPGPVIAVVTALYAGMWPLASVLPTSEGEPQDGLNLVGVATLVYLLVLISACVWAQARGSRRDKRSGGQLPGRPSVRGHASRRPPPTGPGGQLPPAGHGDRHAAEASRSRRPGHRRPWAGAALGAA